jgi:hypothetical protein
MNRNKLTYVVVVGVGIAMTLFSLWALAYTLNFYNTVGQSDRTGAILWVLTLVAGGLTIGIGYTYRNKYKKQQAMSQRWS